MAVSSDSATKWGNIAAGTEAMRNSPHYSTFAKEQTSLLQDGFDGRYRTDGTIAGTGSETTPNLLVAQDLSPPGIKDWFPARWQRQPPPLTVFWYLNCTE